MPDQRLIRNRKGRPTLFRADLVKQAEALGAMGMNYAEIARALAVSHDALLRWRRKYPEFDVAIKTGKEKADTQVVNSLYKLAMGDEERAPNVVACIFWLKNRQPDKWADVQKVINEGFGDRLIIVTNGNGTGSQAEVKDDKAQRLSRGFRLEQGSASGFDFRLGDRKDDVRDN